jgi:hypothetical protein
VGTDFSTTVTLTEGRAAVFVRRWEALEPVRQAVRRVFGAIGKDIAKGLSVRHDHGTQYLSDDFHGEIAFWGVKMAPQGDLHVPSLSTTSRAHTGASGPSSLNTIH